METSRRRDPLNAGRRSPGRRGKGRESASFTTGKAPPKKAQKEAGTHVGSECTKTCLLTLVRDAEHVPAKLPRSHAPHPSLRVFPPFPRLQKIPSFRAVAGISPAASRTDIQVPLLHAEHPAPLLWNPARCASALPASRSTSASQMPARFSSVGEHPQKTQRPSLLPPPRARYS